MSREIMVAVLVTLIVEETSGLSRWSAAKLGHWAAKHIYLADTERGEKRAEEWDALITKSIPTNIAALCFGLSLGTAAVGCIAARRGAVIVSVLSRIYGVLTGDWLAEHNERQMAEHRQASLALLNAASVLRLRIMDTGGFSSEHLHPQMAAIQKQVADTQLCAANVALLAPDKLSGSAERLAEAASRLADTALYSSRSARPVTARPEFAELDESMNAFLRDAVAVSGQLASRGSYCLPGQAQKANQLS